MTSAPDDLISMQTVLKEYKPRRRWWDDAIKEHHITRYRLPGTRGIYLSRADVEELLRPVPLNPLPAWEPEEEPAE